MSDEVVANENGNGASTVAPEVAPQPERVGLCEQCGAKIDMRGTLSFAGRTYHPVEIGGAHGKPGKPKPTTHRVRPCGPVASSWLYHVAYVVERPGLVQTKRSPFQTDWPITNPATLDALEAQLVAREDEATRAVDRQTGAALVGAPLPRVVITAWQLLRSW